MEVLLEEFYKTDLQIDKFNERKVSIGKASYQIVGITHSGKSTLVKKYLLGLKKNSYLYINCNDIRIDIETLNKTLTSFCNKNKIDVLVFDNYKKDIKFVNVSQIIITTQEVLDIDMLKFLELYPLDYEEFLAYEHKYDSSALNHFVQLGGFPFMHKLPNDERYIYLQTILQNNLSDIEFDIMCLCAKFMSQKLSAFSIYERLKQSRKISKDKLYKSFSSLEQKRYIHYLEKLHHTKAIKKIYLCDIALKGALSTEKNFARLFENIIFLELIKSDKECYYDDGVDFYLPSSQEIILCKPFADERRLFKKLQSIEEFIFTHSIKQVSVISMNKESSVSHPLARVEIVPFDIWALGD